MYKNPDDQKRNAASHYARNKEQYRARARKRELEIRVYLNELKDVPCMDCGEKYPPYVMDFDHRPGEEKTIEPARIVKRQWSTSRIDKELAGCDVVCSNCHRIRTHERRIAMV